MPFEAAAPHAGRQEVGGGCVWAGLERMESLMGDNDDIKAGGAKKRKQQQRRLVFSLFLFPFLANLHHDLHHNLHHDLQREASNSLLSRQLVWLLDGP